MIRSSVFCWRGAAAGSIATLPPSAAMTIDGIPPAFLVYSVYGHSTVGGWYPRRRYVGGRRRGGVPQTTNMTDCGVPMVYLVFPGVPQFFIKHYVY
ncbi:hypothetical protein NDU88_006150 [Pleurodeles waltl]|uniref:Secreted protein n=1 Tax=Pleurodeles waltl TaxID=8319 RepID=A0AAV7RKS4_PLEWA|nr:hypothetical protein NDU88_006150 [Pleurodeles waltl]